MKRHLTILAAALAYVALPLCYAADEKQTPTEVLRNQTQFHMLTCQLEEKIALSKAELGEPYAVDRAATCVKNAKSDVKKIFPKALRTVSKNKEATKLLKDYYASWITAIEAIGPTANETKRGYSERLTHVQAQYDSIWNRFEVEAGFN